MKGQQGLLGGGVADTAATPEKPQDSEEICCDTCSATGGHSCTRVARQGVPADVCNYDWCQQFICHSECHSQERQHCSKKTLPKTLFGSLSGDGICFIFQGLEISSRANLCSEGVVVFFSGFVPDFTPEMLNRTRGKCWILRVVFQNSRRQGLMHHHRWRENCHGHLTPSTAPAVYRISGSIGEGFLYATAEDSAVNSPEHSVPPLQKKSAFQIRFLMSAFPKKVGNAPVWKPPGLASPKQILSKETCFPLVRGAMSSKRQRERLWPRPGSP